MVLLHPEGVISPGYDCTSTCSVLVGDDRDLFSRAAGEELTSRGRRLSWVGFQTPQPVILAGSVVAVCGKDRMQR